MIGHRKNMWTRLTLNLKFRTEISEKRNKKAICKAETPKMLLLYAKLRSNHRQYSLHLSSTIRWLEGLYCRVSVRDRAAVVRACSTRPFVTARLHLLRVVQPVWSSCFFVRGPGASHGASRMLWLEGEHLWVSWRVVFPQCFPQHLYSSVEWILPTLFIPWRNCNPC